MEFIPMPGIVLIEPIEDDAIIQSTGRDYTNAGKVTASKEPDIQIGDVIFYDEYAYRRFDWQKKEIFAVDTRGDGVWIIGKTQDDERSTTIPVQEERVSPSVSASPATGQRH